MNKRIKPLKNPDESAHAKADADMRAITPLPVWPLVEAGVKSAGPQFQIWVIAIPQARASTAWFHALVVLTEVLRYKTGPEINQAALRAVMAMERPTTVGSNAALPEPETQDADQMAFPIKSTEGPPDGTGR